VSEGGTIKVFDSGFVRLVDVMGDDKAIVEAARLSVAGEAVKAVQSDKGLIRYLLRNWHTTPFEMVEFKFHMKMPIFVARQMVRHRTASINEMSARYSVLPEDFYVPEQEDIQKQATKNKQGRSGETLGGSENWQADFDDEATKAFRNYSFRLDGGMARELARINLPLSAYTEWYFKLDLHNLMHLIQLRSDPHAQLEIRKYAEAISTFVAAQCPIAYEAFEDFRLNSMTLTGVDLAALTSYREYQKTAVEGQEWGFDWPTKREKTEWLEKMQKLEFL
jgi:thymidylate synthase (FAD)